MATWLQRLKGVLTLSGADASDVRMERHWLTSPMTDVAALQNTLTLCLATLDGDFESRMILADLLEESGRSRAAELARIEQDDDEVRTDVVLGALPGRAVLVLGSDFVERILLRAPNDYRGKGAYLYGLDKVRLWCRREIEQFPTSPVILFDDASQSDVRTGIRANDRNWPLGKAFAALARAIRCVLAEHDKAPTGDPVWFDQVGDADLHIITAAREAREQPGPEEFTAADEQQRQLNRTREFLVEVLTSIKE